MGIDKAGARTPAGAPYAVTPFSGPPDSVVRAKPAAPAPVDPKQVAHEAMVNAQQDVMRTVGLEPTRATAHAADVLDDARFAFMSAVGNEVAARAQGIAQTVLTPAVAQAAAERLSTRAQFAAHRNTPPAPELAKALTAADAQLDAAYDQGLRELRTAGANAETVQQLNLGRDAAKLNLRIGAGDVPGAQLALARRLKTMSTLSARALPEIDTVKELAQLAVVYGDAGALADARTIGRKLLDAKPDDPSTRFGLGVIELFTQVAAGTAQGDAAALDAIASLEKSAPKNMQSAINFARVQLLATRGKGDLNQLEAALQKTLHQRQPQAERMEALNTQFDYLDVGLQHVKGFADRPGARAAMATLLKELQIEPGKNPFDPQLLKTVGARLAQ